jgi:hypothetical protein
MSRGVRNSRSLIAFEAVTGQEPVDLVVVSDLFE